MSEPTLEKIEDYNTLSGEKRRVVWAVIISGLLIGTIYIGAKALYSDVNDALPVEQSIAKVPLK